MNVIKKEGLVEITDNQFDLVSFVMKITHEYKSFKKYNILIDISNFKNLTIKDLNIFLPLIKQHSINKHSFVIVAFDIDFNKAFNKMNIVPTLQEAYDIIELEEIQRDLGF